MGDQETKYEQNTIENDNKNTSSEVGELVWRVESSRIC